MRDHTIESLLARCKEAEELEKKATSAPWPHAVRGYEVFDPAPHDAVHHAAGPDIPMKYDMTRKLYSRNVQAHFDSDWLTHAREDEPLFRRIVESVLVELQRFHETTATSQRGVGHQIALNGVRQAILDAANGENDA